LRNVYLKMVAVFLRNVVCCVEYFYDSGKKILINAAGIIHAQLLSKIYFLIVWFMYVKYQYFMPNLLDSLRLAFSDYFTTLFHISKLGHVLSDMVKTARNSVRTARGGVGDCPVT
jgi:hypothetical protein